MKILFRMNLNEFSDKKEKHLNASLYNLYQYKSIFFFALAVLFVVPELFPSFLSFAFGTCFPF